ncbi:MAG: 4-alpha-glucanotransferase [Chloroflexota bacterium]|nr:4-alpha-glucanotransferase [Chloroflexota bacterium]
MTFTRSAGVLLHPTSFPGRYGIGDLGEHAYRFVDYLQEAGQSLWQVLPLGPTGYGDSPYQCFSAFAGNPLLIDLEQLIGDGLLSWDSINQDLPPFPEDKVDFGWVIAWKMPLLKQSYQAFSEQASMELLVDFEVFCAENGDWLDDFALFMALKDVHDGAPWGSWEMDIRMRQPEAIARWQTELAQPVRTHKYLQWQFFRQWLALKAYANQRGIRLIGDIPIFVANDSSDAWAHPDLFYFDEKGQLTVVAGVPPDYFSETGQLWGNPLYRWEVMAERGYAWWTDRFRAMLTMVDIVRVDHFRGFYNYWEIPAEAETAIDGQWVMGPGPAMFEMVEKELGKLLIIAEDLGDFTPEAREGVDHLMETFGFPGMKILQFAFGSDANDLFLPHNYDSPDWVVYPGTHDNDTIMGWYENTSQPRERANALKYLGKQDTSDLAWDFIRLAWASVARMAVSSAQDLLSLGSEDRMNVPSVPSGNWQWRYLTDDLSDDIQQRLRELTAIYGRVPRETGRQETGKQGNK